MTSKSKKPRTSIKASFISDFEWTYNIIFLVECDEISNNFVSALNETEISDKRIRVIRKQEILNNLKQTISKPTTPSTQSSKGKSPNKLAKINDVKDEKLENDQQTIFNLLKGNKDHYLNLPPNSLANIVKQFINKLKVSYLENNKTLSSKGGGKVTADKKSRNNVDSGGSKKATSSQKSGAADKGKEKQDMVQNQKIVEGIQLPKCLIFTGFYEPLLPVEMNKLGLPVRAVVALKKRTVSSSENVLLQEKEAENLERHLSSKKFNFDFFKFWSYICVIDDVTVVKSEDIADVDIELPEQIASVFETPKRGKNLPANTKKDLKLNINKFLTNLTTHILHSVDIHDQYINSIETYDLDAEYRPLSEAKHYLYLSSLLPFECSDISFVLYNMVDQVSVWHDNKTEYSNEKNKRQQMNIPKIINHNNRIELRTFHLCTNIIRYDIHSVLRNYLSTNPAFNSWRENKINKKQKELNEFNLKRLFKLADNIDQYLFDLYLHWYIMRRMRHEKSSKLESLKKSKTREDSYLNRNRLFRDSISIKKGTKPQFKVEKWRRFSSMSVKHVNALRKANLRKLKKFIEISDIVELVQNDKIVEKLVLDEDDSLFKFAEDLSPICLLQTIQDLSLGFLMCDKLHFKPSNKIILWFHNDIGLTERKDSFKVDTLLGFRDFYKNNMEEESIFVSNLNENLSSEFHSRANFKSERNGDLSLEIKNEADFNVKNDDSKNCEPSKVKVCNLWGSEMELETSTQTFVSADSSSVVLEIDHWLNMTKTMKITIKKRNTELIYHKNMLQTPNEEKENSIYSNAVLNLPDETRVCVDIEEKYLPERFLKLFYNFSIVLPSGLSIEVVKNNGDYYVKQKYVFQSTLTESIKKEKYRCYLKAGHVIIFFKNGRIRILYCNGTIVDCDKIVDKTQKTGEDGISSSLTRESEENHKNMIKKEEIIKKKDEERNKKPGKKDVVDEPEQKHKDNKKILKKSSNSSDRTENKQKTKKDSKNDLSTDESESLKSEIINSFSVLKQSVTTAYGERITFDNGIEQKKKSYSLRTIFQPYETLYIDRSDGYKALYTENGSLLSTFADETKISTILDNVHCFSDPCNNLDLTSSLIGVQCRASAEYNFKKLLDEDSPDERHLFTALNMMTLAEHPLYARVEYNVERCAIRITLPGGMIIYVLENLNDFIIDVDSITTVLFSKENIVFSCGLLDTSGKENITVINSVSKTIGLSKQARKPPIFCKTIDSFGKEFLIHNDGEVELYQSPTPDDSLELISNNSQHVPRGYHFYDKIPSSQFERFFVVNRDFSGHEFVHKDDVGLFLLKNENRLKNKNIKITKNPTCGKLESKTLQYPLFENYFQRYSISYTNLDSYYFPKNFLRSALSKRWNLNDSPWLFEGDVPIEKSIQSKVFQFQTKREIKPMAIVYRTLNEICRNNDNKVKNIATVLLSYEARNNELFCRYSRKRFKRRQLLDKFLGEVIEKPE